MINYFTQNSHTRLERVVILAHIPTIFHLTTRTMEMRPCDVSMEATSVILILTFIHVTILQDFHL